MAQQPHKELDVRGLFQTIKKRWWVMFVIVLLCGALGAAYTSLPRTPLYEASTRIYIQANKDLFSTLKVMLREPVVLQNVSEKLELGRSGESIRGQIGVSEVDGSTILRISVVDSDPVMAARIANTVVAAYQEVARNTIFFTNVIVLTEATVKDNPVPINPKSNRALYLSIIVGLVLGLGLVFLVDSLDDTLKSDQEIEQLLGAPVLGTVSKMRKSDMPKKTGRTMPVRSEAIGSKT